MTSVIPARRRAEEFAGLVDGLRAEDPRYADLLETVSMLRATEAPAPRADYVADLRASLMAAADEALDPVEARLTLPTHTRTRRDRRLAVAVGAVVALGATSSVAVAAQGSLPGDTLYPIKRAMESAQTTISTNDEARGNELLDHASGRLDEASELATRGGGETEQVLPETLDDFAVQAREAADLLLAEYERTGDESVIEQLRDFAASSMDSLAALDALVPAEVRDDVNAAALILAQIDSLAASVCPTCSGGITDIPAMFLLASAAEAGAAKLAPTPVITPGPAKAPAPATDPVTDLLGQLTGTAPTAPREAAPQVSPSPSPSPTPGGATTTDPTEPLTDLTDRLLGGNPDEPENDGLVGDLLDPLTGQGGLLNP